MGWTLALALVAASPAAAQEGLRWRLSVRAAPLRPVSVVDAEGRSRGYWWAPVEIGNETGEARSLQPTARLLTDTKREFASTFRPEVDRAIEAELGREVSNVLLLRGEIGTGETRVAVVVFEDVDALADRFDLRIGGAGASVVRDEGAWWIERVERSFVFERKGDEFGVFSRPLRAARDGWVLVERRPLGG